MSILVCLLILFTGITFLYYKLPLGFAAFPAFMGIYSSQFLIYVLVVFSIKNSLNFLNDNSRLIIVIITAVILRLILIQTEPVLEDDYWRYLWDGRVLAHGVNPYSFKPMATELDWVDVFYRSKIGWKEYGTVYPPISILIFAISHLIIPDSLFMLKVILILFELATGFILLMWLSKLKIPVIWSAIYLLNPLVLKEISNSAHLDAIAVFFTVLAAYLFFINQNKKSSFVTSVPAWVALALAVGSKLYPLCIVPLFFKLERFRFKCLFIFCMTLVFIYLPFLATGFNLLNGTEAFAKHWIFNPSIFKLVQIIVLFFVNFFTDLKIMALPLAENLLNNDSLSKMIVLLIFSLFVLMRTKKIQCREQLPEEITQILGTLLLLSPVCNAWYLLWILPFASITRNFFWISFSYLIMLSYSWWYSKTLNVNLKILEYSVLVLIFFYDIFYHHRKSKTISSISDCTPH